MEKDFYLTETAIKHLQTLFAQEPQGTFLRIQVTSGGCSGFQYHFLFDTQKEEEDIILIQEHNVVVITDEISLSFIRHSELDYVEDLSGAKLIIKNPNAAASCGCGQSFA